MKFRFPYYSLMYKEAIARCLQVNEFPIKAKLIAYLSATIGMTSALLANMLLLSNIRR